jgi:hypothetical protein
MSHATTDKKLGIDGRQMANPMIRSVTKVFSAAEVTASDATPLLLVPAPSSKQVIIHFGTALQMVGGTVNYDRNQNFIARYRSCGGGAVTSTTLANFCNGAAANALSTLRPLATDVVPEAGQPLVLTSSASPYNAAGNRKLAATTWYAIVDLED